MARITFPADGSVAYPAQYPISSLHFEGTGGSYWEIFAGPASGYGSMVTLLQRDQGLSTIADVDGLQLVGPDIEVLSVSMPGGNTFPFTFRSVAGVPTPSNGSNDLVTLAEPGHASRPPAPPPPIRPVRSRVGEDSFTASESSRLFGSAAFVNRPTATPLPTPGRVHARKSSREAWTGPRFLPAHGASRRCLANAFATCPHDKTAVCG